MSHEALVTLQGARVLVTGAEGFFGRHLVEAATARGAQVVAVGRKQADLADAGAVAALFGDVRPDFVVHAAAVGGGIGWMQAHPATSLLGNVLVNTQVLDAVRGFGVRRTVAVSSACAYARDAVQPMHESRLFEGEPEPTNGPYGWAKRMLMVHARALAAEHGTDCVVVVPTNLYGPGESIDPARSHVVGALVRRFVAAAAEGVEEVTCWGTGRATRDLLHVRDAANGTLALLEAGGGPAPVNLGSGVERTIAEIAEAVARAAGFRGRIAWDTSKPDGMPRKVLDTGEMKRRTGWQARTPLEQGLEETVAWYRSSS